MNRCDSHDDCFRRLYEKVEAMDEKLDRLMEGVRDRIRDSDVRFVQLEMRTTRLEEQLKASMSGRMNVKRKVADSIIDLCKMGVIGIIGAAMYGLTHGYLNG